MTGPVEAVVHLIQGLTWLAQHPSIGVRNGVRTTGPSMVKGGIRRTIWGRK